MPHNHRPLCCCQHHPEDIRSDGRPFESGTLHPLIRCPSCVEHGDLANPGCSTCHQLRGRPHTEYCPDGRGLVQ